MTRGRGFAACAVLAMQAVLASCGGADGDRATTPYTVADSAGIRVLSYSLDRATLPVYETLGAPDLEIGAREGAPELAFSSIVDARFGPYGTVLVSDAVSRDIRIFDGDGGFVGRLGQAGEGPGEFVAAPMLAGFGGDTVYAFDARTSRLTIFGFDSELLGTLTIGAGSVGRPSAVHRLPDGGYLARSKWIDPQPSPLAPHDVRLEVDSVVVRRLAADGALVDTLGIFPDLELVRMVDGAANGAVRVVQARPPYMPGFFLDHAGGRTVHARNHALRLVLGDETGRTRTIIRVEGLEHPATKEDIRAFQEAALRAQYGDRKVDPRTLQLNLDFLPERLPAFSALRVAPSGDIWVALEELGGTEGYEWVVFSPDGELRGSVRTPPRMRLLDVEDGRLLGVVTDEFDVPFLRRYPLTPAP